MAALDFGVIIRSAGYLFYDGMVFTLFLTFVAGTLGFVLGILLAVLRLSPHRMVRWLAATYVNTIRSLPLVLVIFWFFFLVPFATQWVLGSPRPYEYPSPGAHAPQRRYLRRGGSRSGHFRLRSRCWRSRRTSWPDVSQGDRTVSERGGTANFAGGIRLASRPFSQGARSGAGTARDWRLGERVFDRFGRTGGLRGGRFDNSESRRMRDTRIV